MTTRLLAFLVAFFFAGAASAQMSADDSLDLLKSVEPMSLSEKDVTGFIAAADDFDKEDVEIDGLDDGSAKTRSEMINRVKQNGAAVAIIKRHGFSVDRFADVSMNVMLAMGALEMQKNQPEIEQSMQQLEAMKGQLPPGQYEKFVDQIMGVRSAFARAPDANVELVAKYRDQIDEIGSDN